MSFAGTAYNSASGEQVDLDGRVHIVASLHGSTAAGWQLDWQANLDHTTGIGETTGSRYVAAGRVTAVDVHVDPGTTIGPLD
ncbi:MAG: hypothetical protein ACR2H3_03105 [Acidimicrobiales bacterium]